MKTFLKMPRLGETMEEGIMVGWLISEGSEFQRGDALFEVETDKTVAEYPALFSGKLIKTLVTEGDKVPVGENIAEIETEENLLPEDLEKRSEWEAPLAEIDSEQDVTARSDLDREPMGDIGPRATPQARRYAAENNISLNEVIGTGRRGRIELKDVSQKRNDASASTHFQDYTAGQSNGNNIIMLHGFAGDKLTFDQLAKNLARNGFNVRSYDLPGHGKSEHIPTNLDDLEQVLLRDLAEQKGAHIVAHSLGAVVAVRVAKTINARSLTLIAPAGLGLEINSDFVQGMANPISIGQLSHFLDMLSERKRNFSDEMLSEIFSALRSGQLKSLANSIAANGQQLVSIRSELQTLSESIGIRIILGMRDNIVNWQDMITVSPKIGAHIFPDAGHMPHWDHPKLVAEIITEGICK